MSTKQHEYPSNYPPGKHWAIDAAWEILDRLQPGMLSIEVRSLLAGMIAGRLVSERKIVQRQRREQMNEHVMNVMDRSGHSTITWNPDDPASVDDAEVKFLEMIARGYTAFAMDVVSTNGVTVEEKGRRIIAFDRKVGKVMMIPQLRGG